MNECLQLHGLLILEGPVHRTPSMPCPEPRAGRIRCGLRIRIEESCSASIAPRTGLGFWRLGRYRRLPKQDPPATARVGTLSRGAPSVATPVCGGPCRPDVRGCTRRTQPRAVVPPVGGSKGPSQRDCPEREQRRGSAPPPPAARIRTGLRKRPDADPTLSRGRRPGYGGSPDAQVVASPLGPGRTADQQIGCSLVGLVDHHVHPAARALSQSRTLLYP